MPINIQRKMLNQVCLLSTKSLLIFHTHAPDKVRYSCSLKKLKTTKYLTS